MLNNRVNSCRCCCICGTPCAHLVLRTTKTKRRSVAAMLTTALARLPQTKIERQKKHTKKTKVPRQRLLLPPRKRPYFRMHQRTGKVANTTNVCLCVFYTRPSIFRPHLCIAGHQGFVITKLGLL